MVASMHTVLKNQTSKMCITSLASKSLFPKENLKEENRLWVLLGAQSRSLFYIFVFMHHWDKKRLITMREQMLFICKCLHLLKLGWVSWQKIFNESGTKINILQRNANILEKNGIKFREPDTGLDKNVDWVKSCI